MKSHRTATNAPNVTNRHQGGQRRRQHGGFFDPTMPTDGLYGSQLDREFIDSTYLGGKFVRRGNFEDQAVTEDDIADDAITGPKIADGAIDTAAFAASIRPIAILAALPTLPDSDYPQGSVAFLTTENKLYRSTGTAWTKVVDAVDIAADSITAGQIAAGAIGATEIAAGAIIASKLAITDFSNLCEDPGFERYADADTTWADPGAMWAIVSNNVHSGTRSAAFTGSTGALKNALVVDVELGQLVVIRGWFKGASSADGNAYIRITWLDSDKTTELSYDSSTNAASTGSYVQLTKSANAPAGAHYARFDFVVAGRTTGTWYADDAYMMRAVGTTIIEDGAITTDKINALAVTAAKIAAGTITANEIASNAITTAKLDALAVTAAKIAAGTITANEIASNAITTDKLNAGAVIAEKIAGRTITASQIATGTITASEIAAGTITANEIAAGAIKTDELDALAVTAAKIAANTITASQIAAGTITATEIASSAITTTKLAASAVTAEKVAANSMHIGLMGEAQNLCPNGGFEAEASTATYGETITGWSFTGTDASRSLSAATKKSGLQCLRVRSDTEAANGHVQSDYIAIDAKRKMIVKVWRRGLSTNISGTGKFVITALWYDRAKSFLTSTVGTSSAAYSQNNTWAEQSETWTCPDTTAAYVRIRLTVDSGFGATDVGFFDDVELNYADRDINHAGGSVLINSSGVTITGGALTVSNTYDDVLDSTANGDPGNANEGGTYTIIDGATKLFGIIGEATYSNASVTNRETDEVQMTGYGQTPVVPMYIAYWSHSTGGTRLNYPNPHFHLKEAEGSDSAMYAATTSGGSPNTLFLVFSDYGEMSITDDSVYKAAKFDSASITGDAFYCQYYIMRELAG